MIRNYAEFRELLQSYVPLCQQFMDKHSLHSRAGIDHICYKCALGGYDFLRALLEEKKVSFFSYQVWLSRRRVSYLRLHESVPVGDYLIQFVELSEAKPGEQEEAGFHHVEIYPFAGAMDYDELRAVLCAGGETLVIKERPHHTTHDITLPDGFIIRLTHQPLIRKISRELLWR